MHILDLIMYVVIFWIILAILGEEYTTEIGGLIGCGVIVVYTVIYVILFVVIDYNWIDIFETIKLNLKL